MGSQLLKWAVPWAFCLVVIASAISLTSASSYHIPRYSRTVSTKLEDSELQLNTTKRVDSDVVESREPAYGASSHYGWGGGYGGGHSSGYGGGGGYGKGNGHGAITLDPVSIISLLALGAFLINNILQLLRANTQTMTSGRSFDVSDIDVPLELSDLATSARELTEDRNDPSFAQFFKNVGSLYYLSPQKRNICIKRVVCGYVKAQRREDNTSPGTFKSRIFEIMLITIKSLVAPELSDDDASGNGCIRFNKYCSDTLIRDAKLKAEGKIYEQLASLVSKLALSKLLPV